MGLYLVRMLVEQLGGRLSAEAAGGARFGIRFQA
jgi:two-component sensor histidine kinase